MRHEENTIFRGRHVNDHEPVNGLRRRNSDYSNHSDHSDYPDHSHYTNYADYSNHAYRDNTRVRPA
jgi:hypothetical protein